MFLITAALGEELATALDLTRDRRKTRHEGFALWTANTAGGTNLCFLKTGVGPRRSSEMLRRALKSIAPSHILTVGYAGALDPALNYGDIVIPRRASSLDDEEVDRPVAAVTLGKSWELASSDLLLGLGKSAGVRTTCGDVLTSWHIIASPEQKRSLFGRFQASIVDMETAALASEAGARNIPFDCVRAITDDAEDSFLEPFSHQADSGIVRRAIRIAVAGHWLSRYSQWKERSALARANLRQFLKCYFDELDKNAARLQAAGFDGDLLHSTTKSTKVTKRSS